MVFWIASWAEDEQLQGKNGLLRRGVLVLGELVWMRVISMTSPAGLNPSPSTVVASPIYKGLGPLPILSGKGSHNGQV